MIKLKNRNLQVQICGVYSVLRDLKKYFYTLTEELLKKATTDAMFSQLVLVVC